jgi:CBS domain-containing protein
VAGFPQGLWLVLIGFFIIAAARAEVTGAQIHDVLSGVRARDLMSTPALSIPEHLTAAEAASEFFLVHRYTSFPVVDESGRALGLVSITQIEGLTPRQREQRRVGEVAERDPALIVGEEEDVASVFERAAFARVGRAVVVDAEGRPSGLLSITDVQRRLRVSPLAQRAAGGGKPAAAA